MGKARKAWMPIGVKRSTAPFRGDACMHASPRNGAVLLLTPMGIHAFLALPMS